MYCSPTLRLNFDELEELSDQLPGRKVMQCDFNARNNQWGDKRTTRGGEQILHSHLTLLNDGTATFVSAATGTSSAIDLSLVDLTLLPDMS